MKISGPVTVSLILLAGFDPQVVHAQYVPMYRQTPVITGDDSKIMRGVLTEKMEGKPEGTSLPWQNPKTGASGTVKLLKRFAGKTGECRKGVFSAKAKDGKESANYTVTTCRQSDGSWKFS